MKSHPGHESFLSPAYPTTESLSSHQGYQVNCPCNSAWAQVTFISLNNGPKCKSSDPGNLDIPKRSHKVLTLSKKFKILDLC